MFEALLKRLELKMCLRLYLPLLPVGGSHKPLVHDLFVTKAFHWVVFAYAVSVPQHMSGSLVLMPALATA